MLKLMRSFAAAVLIAGCGQAKISGESGSIEGTVAGSGQALTVAVPGTANSTTRAIFTGAAKCTCDFTK